MKISTRLILFLTIMVGVVEAVEELPRYEPATCPFENTRERDDIQCGYLVVPENRNRPDGRVLRLSVAVLKSLSDNPQADPLVFLSGGPGNPSVKYSVSRLNSAFWTRYREKRDLVFFDQRGTGFSDPEFCPEMNFALQTAMFRGLSAAERQSFVVKSVTACRESMLAKGIDFAFYNSSTSALDLDDLRRGLGYQQWNLFGISYGTRLALTAMRDTPQGIRSVIIDSTWPPNAPIGDDNERFIRSLRLVFEQCAASAECSAAFPALEQDFFSMLDDFAANPMVLELGDSDRFPDGRIVVDGNLLAGGVFQGLYKRNFIGILPLLVREVRGRNTNVLAALADGLVREQGDSSGLRLAVNCYEWVARLTPELIESDQSLHPELKVWQSFRTSNATCDAWHKQRADVSAQQPVYSEIPTLVAAGEFDPITPPSYGHLTASTLSNSTYIEVPGAGHGAIPFDDCTKDIMAAFLDDPTQSLDTSCVTEMAPASFATDVYVNAGIYQLAKQLQGAPSPVRMASLGLIALLMLSAIVTWPLTWAVRRIRQHHVLISAGQSKARWLAAFNSLLGIGFLFGLGSVVLKTAQENPFLLGLGVPGSAAPIFLLPWLVILATIGTALYTVAAWKRHWWSLASRVHYSLVTFACFSFVMWIINLGLISW